MSSSFAIRMPCDIQSVEVGGQTIVFIDDFLEDPHSLVEAACASCFEPATPGNEQKGYPGLRAPAPVAYTQAITGLLDPLIKVNFGVPDDLPVKVGLSAFSLTTTVPDALGQDPNGVSSAFEESNLGGAAFRVRLVIGR